MFIFVLFLVCLAQSKDQNPPTEIIFEAETTEYETHILNESTTQFSNTVTQIENVTEIELVSENITEFINISSTSTEPTIVSTPKSKKSKKQKKPKIKKIKLEEGCHCDLTKNSCDVNCCCDEECDDQDRSIFSHCLNETKVWFSSNLKYCDSHQEQNHSPWFIDIFSNSLFCVLKNNLPPKIEKKYKTEITSIENLRKVSKQYFSWGFETNFIEERPDFTKNYHFGDKIWIAINDSIQILSVPTNGLNIFCDERKEVKYLKNFKTKCMTNRDDLKTREIYKIYKNMSLISSMIMFNESWKDNMTGCPKNVCIEFEGYSCDKYKCNLLNSTEETRGAITSIRYIFFSNGSEGFTSAQVYFTHSEDVGDVVEQNFEIIHIWISHNGTNKTKELSGNSGYIPGKPIIVSKMVTVKIENTTESIDMLDYFANGTDYPLKNYLYLPENEGGGCLLSNYSKTIVNFGENIQIKCKVKYSIDEALNATNLCINMQKQLLSYAESSENRTTKFLSVNGNPTSDPNDWIELFVETPENDVSGDYKQNSGVLRCKNFISKISYEFVYSLVGEKMVPKLFGADLKYYGEDLVVVVNQGIVDNVLTMTTRFYDVATKQNIEYARGPNLHLTLPNDFFYPFTYSNCDKSRPSMIFGCFVLLVFIFENK